MNIPYNLWTLAALTAIAALLGPDFLSWVMRIVVAAGAAYVPAV